ncbi:hypothetical protein [Sorangium sp. So ce233]|uniref:hypothetical protein n=1 Tax=Sorangium sp. So ce233 TaxID=3133290 RepID=UPI003F63F380
MMINRTLSTAHSSPYDIFVGTWTGTINYFSREGELIHRWIFDVEYKWVHRQGKRLFHFVEHIDSFWDDQANAHWLGDHGIPVAKSGARSRDKLAEEHAAYLKSNQLTKVDFYAEVEGKRITGVSEDGKYHLTGTESACGIFLFMVRYQEGGVYFCNNTYFVNSNLRQTIGPTLADHHHLGTCPTTKGVVQSMNVQTFNRIADRALHLHEPSGVVEPREVKDHSRRALANVYARASVNGEFKQSLKENPEKALKEYAKEHSIPWTSFKNVNLEDVRRILEEQDCDRSPCPPICCS